MTTSQPAAINNPYADEKPRSSWACTRLLIFVGFIVLVLTTSHGYYHRKQRRTGATVVMLRSEASKKGAEVATQGEEQEEEQQEEDLDTFHAVSDTLGAAAEGAGDLIENGLDTLGRWTDQSLNYAADAADQLSEALKNPLQAMLDGSSSAWVDPEDNALSKLLCPANPYTSSMLDSKAVVSNRMDAWLSMVPQHLNLVRDKEELMRKKDHARFFPFEEMAFCNTTLCGGESSCRLGDSGKVCGLENLKRVAARQDEQQQGIQSSIITTTTAASATKGEPNRCIVYSAGAKFQMKFERDVLEHTNCEVHTFDCTGPKSRFVFQPKQHERFHFHHVCIGAKSRPAIDSEDSNSTAAVNCRVNNKSREFCGPTKTLDEILTELGHDHIDILNMDTEGLEWPLLEQWPELTNAGSRNVVLPMQLLVEIHYTTTFPSLLRGQSRYADWKFANDMLELQAHFLRMGYAVAIREDKPSCNHCTKLTLLRIRCPSD